MTEGEDKSMDIKQEGRAPQPMAFDDDCVQRMKATAVSLIDKHPELRTCVVILDYNKGLNDAGEVKSGFWVGAGGNPPNTPDKLLGGVTQTVRFLGKMYTYTVEAGNGLNQDLTQIMHLLVQKNGELEQLNHQIAQAKATLDSLGVQGGAGATTQEAEEETKSQDSPGVQPQEKADQADPGGSEDDQAPG